MVQSGDNKHNYLADFARLEKDRRFCGQPWLHRFRRAAIARFDELGFPNTRQEDWRFTNVAPITRLAFQPAAFEPKKLRADDIRALTFPTDDGIRLVFLNGRYAPALSSLERLPSGVAAGSLVAALQRPSEWLPGHLARDANACDHPFIALNAALFYDGAMVYVPPGTVVADPIHLVFVSEPGQAAHAAHVRNLLVVGAGSRASITESYVGLADGVYFTNVVTDVVLEDHAVVDHCKLQREREQAFHMATTQVHQHRGSNLTSNAVSLGGALARNEINVVLDAEDCCCTLNGLYMARGRQHSDNRTRIDHTKPHCESHELYKGILDDRANGVFNGKIYVHQDAQKTNARQTNQALLLSEQAAIDTKPQLEIYADDVKCTHGATVGQLDEDAIFYLRSRGIRAEAARAMLIYAFANDIVRRIRNRSVRAYFERILRASHQDSQQCTVEEPA